MLSPAGGGRCSVPPEAGGAQFRAQPGMVLVRRRRSILVHRTNLPPAACQESPAPIVFPAYDGCVIAERVRCGQRSGGEDFLDKGHEKPLRFGDIRKSPPPGRRSDPSAGRAGRRDERKISPAGENDRDGPGTDGPVPGKRRRQREIAVRGMRRRSCQEPRGRGSSVPRENTRECRAPVTGMHCRSREGEFTRHSRRKRTMHGRDLQTP